MGFSQQPISRRLRNRLRLESATWDYQTEITDPDRAYLYHGKREEDLERLILSHLPTNFYTIIDNIRNGVLQSPAYLPSKPQGQYPALGVFITRGLEFSYRVEELNSLSRVYSDYQRGISERPPRHVTTKADDRLLQMAEATGTLNIDKWGGKRIEIWLHKSTMSELNGSAKSTGISKSELSAYCIALSLHAHGPSPYIGEGDRQVIGSLILGIDEVLDVNQAGLEGAIRRKSARDAGLEEPNPTNPDHLSSLLCNIPDCLCACHCQ